MSSTTLVGYSNLALYSAMAVYTIAMLTFAFHLAALGPVKVDRSVRRRELVGASAASSVDGGGAADVASPAGRDKGDAQDAAEADDTGLGVSPRAQKLGGVGLSLSWLGTIVLIASVVMRGLAVMRPPWGNMFEFACAGAAAAALTYCVLARRNSWQWLGIFVIGPVLLTLGLALFAFYTEAAELMPALKSVWLVIHVTVAILAVAIFTIAFSIGIVYLLKKKREENPPERRNFMETLPSSARLERTAYGLNMVGFILWTFTLIAGAIWAQKAWSAYWTWDPKEVWTFVIWTVYA
ncbi:MAG: cytochrome c biogenesis protein CcsA, partial [Actinomycetota bacterium]|nr:cytochrome c biogenesis protein CcsA [Actinomycetota bacterium]